MHVTTHVWRARLALVRRGIAGLLVPIILLVPSSPPLVRAQQLEPGFWCPMHRHVRGAQGDKCQLCGMLLIRVSAAVNDRYDVDIETRPRTVDAQRKTAFRFVVRHRESGAMVRHLAVVHERPFHLFLVSQDLEHFAHLHPRQRGDGSFELEYELPKPGVYRLLADFVPADAAPQWVEKTIVTAKYQGTLAAGAAALTPDLTDKIAAGIRVRLGMSPPSAGREQLITFDLSDERSGLPVSDLEPYLGAPGHLLIISEDLSDAVHSHPVVEVSSTQGPTVVFQILFPRGGLYRTWAQFQRGGHVITVPFTIAVNPREAG